MGAKPRVVCSALVWQNICRTLDDQTVSFDSSVLSWWGGLNCGSWMYEQLNAPSDSWRSSRMIVCYDAPLSKHSCSHPSQVREVLHLFMYSLTPGNSQYLLHHHPAHSEDTLHANQSEVTGPSGLRAIAGHLLSAGRMSPKHTHLPPTSLPPPPVSGLTGR